MPSSTAAKGACSNRQRLRNSLTPGHFTTHIRRMRGIYEERRDRLGNHLDLARRVRNALWRFGGAAPAGSLQPLDDIAACRAGLAAGRHLGPLSMYSTDPANRVSGMNPGLRCGLPEKHEYAGAQAGAPPSRQAGQRKPVAERLPREAAVRLTPCTR